MEEQTRTAKLLDKFYDELWAIKHSGDMTCYSTLDEEKVVMDFINKIDDFFGR